MAEKSGVSKHLQEAAETLSGVQDGLLKLSESMLGKDAIARQHLSIAVRALGSVSERVMDLMLADMGCASLPEAGRNDADDFAGQATLPRVSSKTKN